MQTTTTSTNLIERTELNLLIKTGIRVAEVLPIRYWQSGHLPTAINMPLDAIEQTLKSASWSKTDAIVLYCASDTCQNSHIAARKLADLGFTNVRVYAGGKADWKEANLPLEA
jgi:rhodanese-related sulfurtransferase